MNSAFMIVLSAAWGRGGTLRYRPPVTFSSAPVAVTAKRERNGSIPGGAKRATTHSEKLHVSAERAKALVRERLKRVPRPGAEIEAAGRSRRDSRTRADCGRECPRVRTHKGQWWLPS